MRARSSRPRPGCSSGTRSGASWRAPGWWPGAARTTGSGCSDSRGSRPGRWWSPGATISWRWKRPMLRINVVTLFPEVFEAALSVSILGRAAEQQLVRYRVVQLRTYTHDRHNTVADYPYGGGAGGGPKPGAVFRGGGGPAGGAADRAAVGARAPVHAPRRRPPVAGGGADAAVRPLQGRGAARSE